MKQEVVELLQAVAKLGANCTFEELVKHFGASMTLGVVRGKVANAVRYRLIRMATGGVYKLTRKGKATIASKKAARKKTSKTKPHKATDGRRRPSIVVRLDQEIDRTERKLASLRIMRKLAVYDPETAKSIFKDAK